MIPYLDATELEENKRIDLIGTTIMSHKGMKSDKPFVAAVAVDDHVKADRYEKKLKDKFPDLRFLERKMVNGVVFLQVGEPIQ